MCMEMSSSFVFILLQNTLLCFLCYCCFVVCFQINFLNKILNFFCPSSALLDNITHFVHLHTVCICSRTKHNFLCVYPLQLWQVWGAKLAVVVEGELVEEEEEDRASCHPEEEGWEVVRG